MKDTPKETEDIKKATEKAKTKYHKLQNDREKLLKRVRVDDRTIILVKKDVSNEEAIEKFNNHQGFKFKI